MCTSNSFAVQTHVYLQGLNINYYHISQVRIQVACSKWALRVARETNLQQVVEL